MPKGEKPFILYKRAPGRFPIAPRGVSGWLQFASWVALLGALVMWFGAHVEANPEGADFRFGVFLFCMGLIGWLVACLWWMISRAEVVDMVLLERDRQMAKRRRQRKQ